MKTKINKNRSGFTLIEMMAVLAVVGIISSMALSGFMGLTPRTKLKRAARNIVSDMQLAKTMALRDRDTWTMQFDTTNAEYSIIDGDGGTFRIIEMSEFGGVSFGNSFTDRPSEPNAGESDGVSFTDNKIVFNSDGTSVSGSVYITNSDDDTFAVGCLSAAGRIKTWYNFGDGWEE